jgi:four helix bundle protein
MIEKFEDLECWQLSRDLVKIVFEICSEGRLVRDFDTRSQIKRAALSTMNNIAEGFGRRKSNLEFIRFLDYTQSSCCEVKSITYVLEDMNYVDLRKIIAIREKSETLKAKTLSLIAALRRRQSQS